ncbi:MAG: hypothetical protein ACI38Z_03125 [Parafannyhessea sp.]|uniref:hypothetical protein n=1 Tax=Parafannyhessea sp. TaxID=2847324 RepID=UPI003F052641
MKYVEVGIGEGSLGGFDVLETWHERLKGLLGDGCGSRQVLIADCGSIHTVGMRFSIDVAFVSRDMRVCLVRRGMPPGRVLGSRDASFVLERRSCPGIWPTEGDYILVEGDWGLGGRNGREAR